MSDRRLRGRVDGPAPPRRRDAPLIDGQPVCPTGGARHGKLYKLATKWYCPSQEHNGRPVTHRDGPAEPSKHSFTDEEVLASRPLD